MKQEPSREIQLLFFLDKPGRRKQSRHRAAHNVKQLVRNGLLPLLVVLDSQFLEKLLSVVCSHLHRYSPGGMLRGTGIQKYCINLEIQDFRKQDIQDSGSIRLDYVVEGRLARIRFRVRIPVFLLCQFSVYHSDTNV